MDTEIVSKNGSKARRGGARPRNALVSVKKSRNSQRMLIHELIRHYSGLSAITRKAAVILGEPEFSIQNFSNWRNRGWVPLEFAQRLAKPLGVTPYALNFKDVTRVLGNGITWREAVNDSKVFDPKTKRLILELEAPKV